MSVVRRPSSILLAALALAGAAGATGCGAAPEDRPAAAPVPRAVPIGRAARFRPPATPTAAVRRRAPVRGLRCGPPDGRRFGVHLELFAAGRVVVVPAGIGIAAPARREGAYVVPRSCRYAISTVEPTGVLELAAGTHARLGDLFALWGRPLGPRRLAGFRGHVRAWVDGRRHAGDPRAIALTPHRQIVLAVGRAVPVHAAFTFRAGL
jgi:hypothetical protein